MLYQSCLAQDLVLPVRLKAVLKLMWYLTKWWLQCTAKILCSGCAGLACGRDLTSKVQALIVPAQKPVASLRMIESRWMMRTP